MVALDPEAAKMAATAEAESMKRVVFEEEAKRVEGWDRDLSGLAGGVVGSGDASREVDNMNESVNGRSPYSRQGFSKMILQVLSMLDTYIRPPDTPSIDSTLTHSSQCQ